MAHKTTHRRNLATPTPTPETKTSSYSMDPKMKKQPKPTTTTTKPHPTTPDPTVAPPSSSIKHISNQFAKFYANQKILASLKGSDGLPYSHHKAYDFDTNLQDRRALPSNSTVFDSSCITLTKSNSQHGKSMADGQKESTRTKVKEKDKKSVKKSHQEIIDVEKAIARQKYNEGKKASKKESKEDEFYERKDVKKSSPLMSKSLESDELMRFDEVCEMKRPSISLAMNGRRRKSFCCSQTELADFFSCTGVKVVAVDMPPFMQIHAVDCARKAHDSLEKFTSKSLAFTLKKEFDGVYGPAWHCIIGTSFGSFVTHSVGGFMYFSMDHKFHILLFKTTVQRAD